MKKNNLMNLSQKETFLYHMKGVKQITQDKIYHMSIKDINKCSVYNKDIYTQEAHSHYFRDIVDEHPHSFKDNPICFVRNVRYNFNLKKLKRGEYIPEIVLDLHGVNLYQARKELGKLITICHQENFFCASILHGHGKKILKRYIPFWLSKHPDILAFHQAPKIFGYDAAILVVIKNNNI
ncbi:endonuclease SmrB [Buchnera aphidicola]|uniref:Ribosome rescue factor SmrB n=1 Tax=Buchnera aphidicola (Cinara laricifoliae) TaxID=2518977 RepID=A0A451DB19_9GAMM|nr:endonuclease SmrB [Buchnera aphidicola]VFP83538.1 UPF0115 protein YfcN [Buchnera aphidicola (Cinara laricifoliae)]